MISFIVRLSLSIWYVLIAIKIIYSRFLSLGMQKVLAIKFLYQSNIVE